MYNKKGRLSASLASRLSKGGQGQANFQNRGRMNNMNGRPGNMNRRNGPGIQSRLGMPMKSKDSVYNRINSGGFRGRQKQPLRAYQPSLNLIKNEIMNISTAAPSRSSFSQRLNVSTGTSFPRRNRIQSRTSRSEAIPVRMNNGAIVTGLRSDKLVVEKYREERNREKPVHRQHRPFESPMRMQGKIMMDMNSGLKVSISNEAAKRRKNIAEKKAALFQLRAEESNDDSMSADEIEPLAFAVHPQTTSREDDEDQAELRALLRINTERPKLPKPHRQVLDPQVQKEIAALQGHADQPHSSGPGPGVKNFRMMPSLTRSSLSQRFTIEKASQVRVQ